MSEYRYGYGYGQIQIWIWINIDMDMDMDKYREQYIAIILGLYCGKVPLLFLMNFLQHLRNYFTPSPARCSDTGIESHYDTMVVEDEFEAHIPQRKHKVPGFEGYFNNVLMVTSNPEMIRGFRFEFSLPLSEYFTFSHAWTLPNAGTVEEANPMNPMMPPVAQKPSYTFTTQLVQDIRGQEPHTIMMGKADGEGKVDAILIRKLHENINARITGSFQSSNVQQGMLSMDVEVEGRDSMSVFRLGQGHCGFSIMQRVHRNLLLGFDYTNLTSQKLSFLSYGAKAFLGHHSLFAQYVGIQDQYNIGYIIPLQKGTQFVAQYKYEGRERKPSTILGFKQRYSESDIMATVNSKGEVTTNLFLRNPNYGLRLCAVADFLKDKYTFGYGIVLGQIM